MQFKRIETLSTFRNMKGREMRELKEPVLITSQPPSGVAEPLVVLLPYNSVSGGSLRLRKGTKKEVYESGIWVEIR